MKHLNSRMITTTIFFAAAALLVFYLLSERWQVYLPVNLFWMAVALMLGTIAYQILGTELSPSYVKILLFEIAVACFAFHMIYQIPVYGLNGRDPYLDMASAKGILSSRFVMGDPAYINDTSYFPIIHILGAVLAMMTGVDLFTVAKWFPSLLGVVIVPLLYLLGRSVFKDERIALISTLLFVCLQNQISFNSAFIRETIAVVLAMMCVYLYFSAKHSRDPRVNYALSITCFVGTVFAHHLTSFMLLMFLSTHFLVTRASEIRFFRRFSFRNNIMGEKVTSPLLLFGFVAIFAYWTYVIMSPLNTIITFARDIFTLSQLGLESYSSTVGISASSIRTLRGNVLFYGFFSFHLILGLILCYGLLPRAKMRRLETSSFTLFLFLCGFVGFASMFLVVSGVFPDRFLLYGWLFGFMPLAAIILRNKHKWIKRIGVSLLVAFMLFNIYMIEPVAWDASSKEVTAGISQEDYALANRLDFSRGNISGFQNALMAIYDVHNVYGYIIRLSSKVDVTEFEWIVIQKSVLELVRTGVMESTETAVVLERFASECPVGYNRIYESNNLVVVKANAGG